MTNADWQKPIRREIKQRMAQVHMDGKFVRVGRTAVRWRHRSDNGSLRELNITYHKKGKRWRANAAIHIPDFGDIDVSQPNEDGYPTLNDCLNAVRGLLADISRKVSLTASRF